MKPGELMELTEVFAAYAEDMQLIEAEMISCIKRGEHLLHPPALHLLEAGGKRLRPLYVLISGNMGRYDIQSLKRVAVPIELIHMATLVHDDVIDESELRRGRPTVRRAWDNQIAMYTGDYILAQALSYFAELDNPLAHQVLSRALVQMSLGEINQIRDFFKTQQSLRQYLHRTRRKTALLIATCCQLGGMVSGLSYRQSQQLYLYGYYVGMAFQITDDILDIVGDPKRLGKPAGSDLRQGNLTLPVIYAIQKDGQLRQQVTQLLEALQRQGEADELEQSFEQVRSAIIRSGALEYAEHFATRYLDKAIQALQGFAPSPARKQMELVARTIVGRSF